MERALRIADYRIAGRLGESPQSVVYLGYARSAPGTALALKVLKVGTLSELQKVHFRQKIEHLKVLNDPTLLRPLAFEITSDAQLITREHFDGLTLNEWVARQEKVSLDGFLAVACQLARSLAKVHEAGIIHGSIKPHNVLIDPKSLNVRLIDFMTALDVREVSHFIYDLAFVKCTLAYTSPEQTGRINHRVDFTSDLYSLGVVFYELLTGRLPFFSLDPLELIHSHLAEEAAAVHEVDPQVPEMIGSIISKLILKEPEKRYQSGTGLLADLERCRADYAAHASVTKFSLGLFDFTHRVRFVSKMVGREAEARQILGGYAEAASGSFSSLLISGLPGIGKTRLIQELQRPIVKRRGYFTSGKFDLYQRNIPYGALIQSFRSLIRTFLTESDSRVETWRERILGAVGTRGRVLTDVIPELEVLIGTQPDVEPLPPAESRNRFNDVFNAFLICLASEEHPLTLFIDDLQWCDSATFDFLGNLFANTADYKYLFLLGAYRHNEVDSAHPLTRLVHEVRQNKRPLKEIRLGPLAPESCHEMVSYILDSPMSKTAELATFITRLSDGNPLFVSEVLSYLHNENLLSLDEDRVWQWNLERIRESDMPSTVVALFTAKIEQLPKETVELLKFCACMGNRFLPADVAAAREIQLLDVFETLKSALAQGLIMESKESLQFVHDRVQEAVLATIGPERRRKIHWEIGTHLISAVPEGRDLEKLDNLFEIVAHLNLGRGKRLDKPTAYRLSELNHRAGDKALKALATEAANDYFRTALELLPASRWQDQHEQTFTVYRKAAKTELMCGNYADSERLLDQLLAKAKTDLDKAEALAEQTTSLSSIGNFIKAVETANRGLAYFGKAIPDDPEAAEAERERVMREIDALGIDVWDTILHMPFTNERKSKTELAFYSELIPDLYMSGLVPQLYLSAVQSTQHCLAGGMDESVIYSFSIMGLHLGEKGEFGKAFKYEDLAHDLCAKYPNTFGATRGMNGIVWCNMHSRSTPAEIVDYCRKGIQCGRNSGDLYNAGLSYGPLMWNLQVQGDDLRKVEAAATECLEFSKKYHLNFSVRLAEAIQAGWIEPMKRGYVPQPMDDKLRAWEKDNHVASAGSYFVHMALVQYYLGRHEEAEGYLRGVERYLTGLTDNVLKRQWHVFLALNALRLHELGQGYESEAELKAYIAPLVSRVETWASLGPLLEPYLALLLAEVENVTGDAELAKGLYLGAISTAHRHGYVFLEGYLNERLGGLIERGAGASAEKRKGPAESQAPWEVFIREAGRLYRRCHAERKEDDLVQRYPQCFESDAATVGQEEAVDAFVMSSLDVGYLVKSSTAISSEIDETRLMNKIMRVVLEASGAQRGYLITAEDKELMVRARSEAGTADIVTGEGKNLEASPEICAAIVRYVNRTRETVVLEDAAETGSFKDHPEVQALCLRSVLCLPIIKQSEIIGILYLENGLAPNVFTPDKTEMTRLLSQQAAISLENARLVEREKAEQKALAASKYARRLIEVSPDPLVTISPEGRITDVNRATEAVTGVSREELVGTDFSDYFTEPEQARAGYLQAFSEGFVRDYPLAIRHTSGAVTDVLYNATVYRSEEGEVVGVFAAARDITERKRAEEEILRLASIVESSDDAIIGKTLDGVIVTWNAGAERLYGYSAEEIVAHPVAELMTPEGRDELPPILERIGGGEHIRHHEAVRVCKDGSLVDVSLSIAPIKDAEGVVIGVSTIARDVTERKRAEERVRAASLYARSLIEASLDPLVTISPGGKITDVNRATEDVTGVARDELIGTDFSDYFTEPDKAREGYREVFSAGFVIDYPLAIRHASGRVTDVLYNGTVYRDEDGSVSGVFAAARDITARKHAEEEIRHLNEDLKDRARELEVVNRELEAFNYSVSHDLRAPLRSIDGFSQLLLEQYDDTLDPIGQDRLRRVRAAAQRMAELIDDLLDLSRVTRGEMRRVRVDLSSVACDIADRLRAEATGRQIVFEVQPKVSATGDPRLLRIVLENLLGNAAKFTAGTAAPHVEFGAEERDGHKAYYVRDNGAGFDMAYVDKLFKPFQRLHSTEEFPGTGIGLALVQRIVFRHGGNVWAEGETDGGATFYFDLGR
jgi:PAS domain S-box-containing protein